MRSATAQTIREVSELVNPIPIYLPLFRRASRLLREIRGRFDHGPQSPLEWSLWRGGLPYAASQTKRRTPPDPSILELDEWARAGDDRVLWAALAFVTKAETCISAVAALYRLGLPTEAQVHVRVAFELHVRFFRFVELVSTNPKAACQRLVDAITLEKVRQQRCSNFAGLDEFGAKHPNAPSRESLLKSEKEIAARYAPDELAAIKKHGFAGASVEQLARAAGVDRTYNVIYRNFSRNVHSGDFVEMILSNSGWLWEEQHRAEYVSVRDKYAVDVALGSVGAVADLVNDWFALGYDRRLRALKKAHTAARRALACD
jgi:hypothetical protein